MKPHNIEVFTLASTTEKKLNDLLSLKFTEDDKRKKTHTFEIS